MLYYYAIISIVLIIDRLTKWFIVKNVKLYDIHPVIGDFFSITSHRNRGAAFGILQDQRVLFIVLTVFIVAGVAWYLHHTVKEKKRLLPFALSLVMGGAIGNFIDRLVSGEVVDFFRFDFQFSFFGKAVDYTFPIFNIADSAIFIGVVLVFIDTVFELRQEKRSTLDNDHA